ncbi:glycoside hydrolase family 16 protein [Zobellia laminariae]|uniref:glycoside hydrolase family 16 protein n=1 Tax=Zobellia laminariae TaxID=248906 RepID=UPI003EF96D7B
MKSIIKFKSLLFVCLVGTLANCSNSDGNLDQINSGKPEINDRMVVGSNVNALDYWSDTKLVWSDEFNGSDLSKENWFVETSLAGVGYPGWQNFTADENLELSDGTLKIISKKTGLGQKEGDYTSARINSNVAFTYGKFEVRAKLSGSGSGLWSKLVLLGNNIGTVGYPKCGQISFMEYTSHIPNRVFNTVHTAENVLNGENIAANSGFIPLETAEEEFHIYGILWTDEYLKFYIDTMENIVYTFIKPSSANENNWPFSKSLYFVLDTSVGTEFSDGNGVDDGVFPATFEIDYVRVYHAQ